MCQVAGALMRELGQEDLQSAVERAATEPLEHLTLAELNTRKVLNTPPACSRAQLFMTKSEYFAVCLYWWRGNGSMRQ